MVTWVARAICAPKASCGPFLLALFLSCVRQEFVIANEACFLSFITQLIALVSSVISFITLNFY